MRSLESGDCYVTIHSNLSSVQIIFHLVYTCDSMTYHPLQNDPQMMGLKNAIELCMTDGLSTILIPLFLVYIYTSVYHIYEKTGNDSCMVSEARRFDAKMLKSHYCGDNVYHTSATDI
ncbi:hypothetical protein MXB_2645 [Myxobolus squamalis]|nr:hypothetical protein MXB_2645 [Myxobolus squamalis]